jgi:hypothetical protein
MECLNNHTIQQYIEGDLNNVEKSIVRDHLIVCERCQIEYQSYLKVDTSLKNPVYINPPSIIEKYVLKKLFPLIPSYTSIFVFIAASFLLMITGIYIYFDFANNSIVKALQLTSHNTTNWIGSIIKIISTVFSTVYAIFKAINKFFEIVFKINIGVEIIAIVILLILIAMFYSISQLLVNKIRGQN